MSNSATPNTGEANKSLASHYQEVYWAFVNGAPPEVKSRFIAVKESGVNDPDVDLMIPIIAKMAEEKYDRQEAMSNKKALNNEPSTPST